MELHWCLTANIYDCDLDSEQIWSRAIPCQLGQQRLRALTPEDLLIYTTVHAIHHFDCLKLIWLCDLAEILERYGDSLDWCSISARCQQWNARRAVYGLLRLAQELLAARVGEAPLAALCPPSFPAHYLTLVRNQLLKPVVKVPPDVSESLISLWNTTRFSQKIALIGKRLLLSRAAMARLYPVCADSWRIYYYYLVRAKDLLVRYGVTTLLVFIGERKAVETTTEFGEILKLRKWLLSG